MSHVIHYGSSVFEGIRCYGQPQGSAVFRLPEHMQRLLDSAKIYRMELPFTLEELCAGVVDVIEANGVTPCYIRPIALRGYGEIGVSPKGSPIEVYIANFPWGKYIAGTAARMCASPVGTAWRPTPCPRWPRPAPTT
jgi:branched-chain amino acid aminotransferase